MAKKKSSDRDGVERNLGRATHAAGNAEMLVSIAGKALNAIAEKELAAFEQAQKNLNACRAKIVEINEQLTALDS